MSRAGDDVIAHTSIDAREERMNPAEPIEAPWEKSEREREERRRQEVDRAFELQERQIAAQEALARAASQPEHRIIGDAAVDRMTAFWEMPKDQQDFRLREEAMTLACRLGGAWEVVEANALRIIEFIRGD